MKSEEAALRATSLMPQKNRHWHFFLKLKTGVGAILRGCTRIYEDTVGSQLTRLT